jgi:hypothetical protein
MSRPLVVLLSLTACGVELNLPQSPDIICATNADCPTTLSCHTRARRCVNPASGDTAAPLMSSASATDSTHVIVQLSELCDPSTVVAANFTVATALAGGAPLVVSNAVIADSLRSLTLEVGEQQPGVDYLVMATARRTRTQALGVRALVHANACRFVKNLRAIAII